MATLCTTIEKYPDTEEPYVDDTRLCTPVIIPQVDQRLEIETRQIEGNFVASVNFGELRNDDTADQDVHTIQTTALLDGKQVPSFLRRVETDYDRTTIRKEYITRRTTLIIRDLPEDSSKEELLELISRCPLLSQTSEHLHEVVASTSNPEQCVRSRPKMTDSEENLETSHNSLPRIIDAWMFNGLWFVLLNDEAVTTEVALWLQCQLFRDDRLKVRIKSTSSPSIRDVKQSTTFIPMTTSAAFGHQRITPLQDNLCSFECSSSMYTPPGNTPLADEPKTSFTHKQELQTLSWKGLPSIVQPMLWSSAPHCDINPHLDAFDHNVYSTIRLPSGVPVDTGLCFGTRQCPNDGFWRQHWSSCWFDPDTSGGEPVAAEFWQPPCVSSESIQSFDTHWTSYNYCQDCSFASSGMPRSCCDEESVNSLRPSHGRYRRFCVGKNSPNHAFKRLGSNNVEKNIPERGYAGPTGRCVSNRGKKNKSYTGRKHHPLVSSPDYPVCGNHRERRGMDRIIMDTTKSVPFDTLSEYPHLSATTGYDAIKQSPRFKLPTGCTVTPKNVDRFESGNAFNTRRDIKGSDRRPRMAAVDSSDINNASKEYSERCKWPVRGDNRINNKETNERHFGSKRYTKARELTMKDIMAYATRKTKVKNTNIETVKGCNVAPIGDISSDATTVTTRGDCDGDDTVSTTQETDDTGETRESTCETIDAKRAC